MDVTTLVAMGAFVALLWLCVAFLDRIQRWRTPWGRWFVVPQNMQRVLKVLSIGFAIVVSLCYAGMLVVAAGG